MRADEIFSILEGKPYSLWEIALAVGCYRYTQMPSFIKIIKEFCPKASLLQETFWEFMEQHERLS